MASSSLFRLLCRTRTQAGAKLFRQWLANPLVDGSAIRERQDAVQSLLEDVDLFSNVQEVHICLLPKINVSMCL